MAVRQIWHTYLHNYELLFVLRCSEKSSYKNAMKHIMATGRLVATAGLLAAMAVLTPLQAAVIGPVFKNYKTIPDFFYNSLCRIFGLKVRFNAASAPIEDKRQSWTVANHMSIADFAVLGSQLKGTFAGKGDILEWPGIAQMARAVRYIGLKRASKKDAPELYQKNMLKARSKIISEFNDGRNVIMFPEGTTTDGKEVALFRAGLIKLLFGGEALGKNGEAVKIDREVVVQPVAIHVVEVNGKNAVGNDDLRNSYSLQNEGMLSFVWKRAQVRRTVIELTAFKPLEAKDFESAEDMINEAHRLVRSVVAPQQTVVAKAFIPGMDDGLKSNHLN
jgi:1-acyl-sn-glycerol-3-phosphate acyltransferase